MLTIAAAVVVVAALNAGHAAAPQNGRASTHAGQAATDSSAARGASTRSGRRAPALTGRRAPLPRPAALKPFQKALIASEGVWHAAGRRIRGIPAVYETTLVPPDGTQPAGIAWMDTHLLAARLYSGSGSPGGGPYKYTAPILPQAAKTLVAAFNGGFYMTAAEGGYYTEGKLVYPLRTGAASLVIYRGGWVNVGAWGSNVSMTRNVIAVRQNLVPLVAAGHPTALAYTSNWLLWGATCGATNCASTTPGIEHQWRSGVGVTADGALVYVQGPGLDPLQVAQLLVRAGVIRGMQLDINPYWPVLVTYRPATPLGEATPANGSKLLKASIQGPATFFTPSWARDFITMSARVGP